MLKFLNKMASILSQKDIFYNSLCEDQNERSQKPSGVALNVSAAEERGKPVQTSTSTTEGEADIESRYIATKDAPIHIGENSGILFIGSFRTSDDVKHSSNNDIAKVLNITIIENVGSIVTGNTTLNGNVKLSKMLEKLKAKIQFEPGIISNQPCTGDGSRSNKSAKEESNDRSEFCLASVKTQNITITENFGLIVIGDTTLNGNVKLSKMTEELKPKIQFEPGIISNQPCTDDGSRSNKSAKDGSNDRSEFCLASVKTQNITITENFGLIVIGDTTLNGNVKLSKMTEELKPKIQFEPGIISNQPCTDDGSRSNKSAKDGSNDRSEFCLASVKTQNITITKNFGLIVIGDTTLNGNVKLSKMPEELKPKIQFEPGIISNQPCTDDGFRSNKSAKDELNDRSEFCLASILVPVDSKH